MQSLNNRLERIESVLQDDDDLITRIRKKEQEKKNNTLKTLIQGYRNYIIQSLPDLEEADYDDNIVQIISLTIKYYAENETNISKLLGVKSNNEVRGEVSVTLIHSFTIAFTPKFIFNTIEFLTKPPPTKKKILGK